MQMVTYQRLYNILREKIWNKVYVPGTKLPTERALCDEYGVSRITVRHALMLLEEQGLIERMQGRGTFVKASKPKKIAIMDYAYSKSMKQESPDTMRKLITRKVIVPPRDIASSLSLLQNEECLYFERLDINSGENLAFDQVYIPLEFSKSLKDELLTRIDFLSIWEKNEPVKLSFVKEAIEAIAADDFSAKRLSVPIGSPILMDTEIVFDKEERPVAVFISKYRYDRFKMVSTYFLGNSS
ncbi:MAG: hypothetical protein DRP70_00105 [Spirochaetes bacterium]|nr:MAG: hypothetical protein DRP70_00105 [Spirochaetota bacterium]